MPASETLRVRVYNVRFGDAILISVPDKVRRGKIETRHILIDVGNVLSGTGGGDEVFGPVIENVLEVLDGKPLDLYVMTHEHMDHVQGLFYAATKLGLDLEVQEAWLTASAAGDYYETHEDAKKKRSLALDTFDAMERFLAAAPEPADPVVLNMLFNNNPRNTTECVDHLRKLAGEDHTVYVYRGCGVDGSHLFHEEGTAIELWAPEEDTSVYYGRFRPMALGLDPVQEGGTEGAKPALTTPLPPPGVDAGAFYDLVASRSRGIGDNLLSIDAAANNSSVVFCLEWRGWRLLFPGDAEHRSWKQMNKVGALKPVHFLKVGHHGSANGTPPPELLDKILPEEPEDGRPRFAAVSTCTGSYSGVPHKDTMELLASRCTLRSVEDLPEGEPYMDFHFPPKP